ncbi:hypothetical protein CR513_36529, partial [Mucuna pruriens]
MVSKPIPNPKSIVGPPTFATLQVAVTLARLSCNIFEGSINCNLKDDKSDKCYLGQGYKEHLTNKANFVVAPDRAKWEKIDAQLCNVIKSTLHPSIHPIFQPHVTYESVWSKDRALHIQRLYGMCNDLMTLIAPQKVDGSMSTYIGKVHATLHDFNELLPPAATNHVETKELENCSTFFKLFALYGLPSNVVNSGWQSMVASPKSTIYICG